MPPIKSEIEIHASKGVRAEEVQSQYQNLSLKFPLAEINLPEE